MLRSFQNIQAQAQVALLNNDQASAAELGAAAKLPANALMQRAGDSIARLARACFPFAQRITVVCGTGNNGGDGLIAAKLLHERGLQVTVQMPAAAKAEGAIWALHEAEKAGVAVLSSAVLGAADLIIDAVLGAGFGAGKDNALRASAAALIAAINAHSAPKLAVDLPSGLSGSTGKAAALNTQLSAVHADVTLALLALRPGHFTSDAPGFIGALWFDDLGVIVDSEQGAEAPAARLNAPEAPAALLNTQASLARPTRSPLQHKGSSGNVWLCGGAPTMRGALTLASRAALACGAGRVYVQALGETHTDALHDALAPGLMFRPHSLDHTHAHLGTHLGSHRPDQKPLADATLVFGTGVGVSTEARAWLTTLAGHHAPLLLDADGLNILATDSTLARRIAARTAATVLTPHPLEAARLLGNTNPEQVQADRLSAAAQLAEKYHAVVVLKGPGTVIAAPGQVSRINPTGNQRLATAGSGDVLAGVIAALIAQGLNAFDAACTAVFAHGLAAQQYGDGVVLQASDQGRAVAAVLATL